MKKHGNDVDVGGDAVRPESLLVLEIVRLHRRLDHAVFTTPRTSLGPYGEGRLLDHECLEPRLEARILPHPVTDLKETDLVAETLHRGSHVGDPCGQGLADFR